MPDVRNDEKVKELFDDIQRKVKDLSDVVRVQVLQDLIARLQTRLDERQAGQGQSQGQPQA